jgi:hypothetical protein
MVGRWLGALAHHTRGEPLSHRLLVMFGICTVLVGILGSVGNLESMILPVMIPSAVNCLILERRTRAPSQLPTAALA